MEEARFWMWTKRRANSSSEVVASANSSSTYGDSWEEQAFAEDAAGPLGGCIWPPRSYTCTFCRREFRSAQALGGHMNVHRRDRARLKQSPISPNNNNLLNPNTSLGIHQYPSHQNIQKLVYNNSDSDHEFLASPSRVSVPIVQVKCDEKSSLVSPSFSSPIFQEQQKKTTSAISPPLWSDFVVEKYSNNISTTFHKEDKNLNFLDPKFRAKRDYVSADLSVSLNFVICHQSASSGEEEEEEEDDDDDNKSCKRRRVDDNDGTTSFFPKQNSVDRTYVLPQSEVIDVIPNSKEDLDLELRLGDHRST